MKDGVIGSGKPKRVSKNPREYKVRKWAKDTEGERNWPKEPISNVMGQESPK